MHEAELLALIRQGEGQTLEFKEQIGHPNQLGEHLCAFANADAGGTLLLGVADDGTIVGLRNPDHAVNTVLNVSRNNITPPLRPAVETVIANGRNVVVVTVQGLDRPYQTRQGKFMIRVGASKREMSREEILRLFLRRGTFFYDEVTVEGTTLNDLDQGVFRTYLQRYHDPAWLETLSLEQLAVNMKLAKRTDDQIQLTIAGLLLFGREPQSHMPYTRVSAVSFRGTEVGESEILLSKEIYGRLDQLIEDSALFVERNTFVTSELKNWRREDHPQYHVEAVREAIVNAVAHRDYSIVGSQIRLFVFNDRLEVRSPGRPPNTVTLENIRLGLHAARNPVLYTHLTQMGYMKRVGIGVPTMIRLCRELSGREPDFALVGEEFRVTLWARQPGKRG